MSVADRGLPCVVSCRIVVSARNWFYHAIDRRGRYAIVSEMSFPPLEVRCTKSQKFISIRLETQGTLVPVNSAQPCKQHKFEFEDRAS